MFDDVMNLVPEPLREEMMLIASANSSAWYAFGRLVALYDYLGAAYHGTTEKMFQNASLTRAEQDPGRFLGDINRRAAIFLRGNAKSRRRRYVYEHLFNDAMRVVVNLGASRRLSRADRADFSIGFGVQNGWNKRTWWAMQPPKRDKPDADGGAPDDGEDDVDVATDVADASINAAELAVKAESKSNGKSAKSKPQPITAE